ncbi:MAG: 3-hydroxyacyl-CoA dehydrogenase NAD-binding domain-containing protein [Acidimicrobiales bacterium]
MSGTQSAAQRYYFFAERQAAKVPGIDKSTPLIPIETCGILGAGTMGGGIAMNFANVGLPSRSSSGSKQRSIVASPSSRATTTDRPRGSITAIEAEERLALITGSIDKTTSPTATS